MSYSFDPHRLLDRPEYVDDDGETPADVFDAVAAGDTDASQTAQSGSAEQQPKKQPKNKKLGRRFGRTVAGIVLTVVSLGALAAGGTMIYDELQPAEAPVPETEFSAADQDTYTGTTIDDYIEQLVLDSQTGNTVYDHMADPDMAIHGDQADRTGITHIDANFDGAGVWIPSLDIVSPMISTDHNGVELILPEPPSSTWYNQTAEVGADEGNTMIASHVNWGHGDDAPFSQLHKIDKGAPIFVRDFEGNDVPYVVTEIEVYDQQALPDDLFSLEGDHQLQVLTCSGPTIERGGERYFMYNLVVTAEPYNPGVGA